MDGFKGIMRSLLLLELEEDDFRAGADAHGRTPGSDATGGVDLEGAEALQTIRKFAEGAMREPGEGKALAAVGVAGELEADAGLLCDG